MPSCQAVFLSRSSDGSEASQTVRTFPPSCRRSWRRSGLRRESGAPGTFNTGREDRREEKSQITTNFKNQQDCVQSSVITLVTYLTARIVYARFTANICSLNLEIFLTVMTTRLFTSSVQITIKINFLSHYLSVCSCTG